MTLLGKIDVTVETVRDGDRNFEVLKTESGEWGFEQRDGVLVTGLVNPFDSDRLSICTYRAKDFLRSSLGLKRFVFYSGQNLLSLPEESMMRVCSCLVSDYADFLGDETNTQEPWVSEITEEDMSSILDTLLASEKYPEGLTQRDGRLVGHVMILTEEVLKEKHKG